MDIVYKCGIGSMDFERVTEMLSQAYWSSDIKIDEIKKAAVNSALVIGAFSEDDRQIAYGRVISDKTRFAYLTDFYVDMEFRKKGICRKMAELVLAHPDLADVYQWLLVTGDAHGLYEKCGFKVIARPLDFMEIRSPRPKDR
ncbi:MAG: GNAT family N-acetyltransferase [Synergistaceae bacterium]|jgi:ribosomal protein S18 acetylase RimI-like enzyme|nr:GNAT family N-acetyltransferase [Synergistaceae bacterium]MCK9436471.1 GNAT family N-acetyltransferase [Synergistaceae bacterium]MDD2351012.1 GNAT family N-acetyltransferase [Synergistaceae bacterium]MDD3318970.1 GNAT family N-acetyltransferase [Synergistaceae bacterium]MDD3672929.1 GNAT family N-acetyltransferase [Synergistaceae bacterium]